MIEIPGYTIIRRIGSGGMGVVYEAEQDYPRRRVALKVLRNELTSERDNKRLETEAQILAQLSHPGIARIFEAGWFDHDGEEQAYFTMELIEGKPIDIAAQELGLRFRERVALFLRVCEAVEYAHQNDILHRDIKPDNILTEPNGQPKILDFGLARPITGKNLSLTTAEELDEVLGTVPYMSPGALDGTSDGFDMRSDVYALGVLGYKLFTGQLPHDPMPLNVIAFICQVAKQEPKRAGELNNECRGDLETILAKALMKDRAHRYGSVHELASDIRAYFEGKPIRAKEPGLYYRANKLFQRKRQLIRVSLLTVLIGLLGVWGTVRQSRRALESLEQGASASLESKLFQEQAEQRQYLADIRFAQTAINDGHLTQAKVVLRRSPARLRNWEWSYLWQIVNQESAILRGHQAPIRDVKFNPTGDRIVSVSDDGAAILWDFRELTRIATMQGHEERISYCDFSPDGSMIVTASDDHTAHLWSYEGKDLFSLSGHTAPVNKAKFSPNGGMIITAGDDADARIYDAKTGACIQVLTGHTDCVFDVDWHPNGRWVATASDDSTARIWDAVSGKFLGIMRADGGEVNAVRFTPSTQNVITVHEAGGAYSWDLEAIHSESDAVEMVGTAMHDSALRLLRWGELTANGSHLVLASRLGTIGLWEVSTGRLLGTHFIRTAELEGIGIDPQGLHVAFPTKNHTIHTFSVADLTRNLDNNFVYQGHESFVTCTDYDTSGNYLASGSTDKTIRIWSTTPWRNYVREKVYANQPVDFRFTSQSTLNLLLRDIGRIHIDPLTMEERESIETPFPHGQVHVINTAREEIISVSEAGTIFLRRLSDGWVKRKVESGTTGTIFIEVEDAGRFFVTYSESPTCYIWNAETGESIGQLEGHDELIRHVAINPSGQLIATAGADNTIKIWDPKTQKILMSIKDDNQPKHLSFHPKDNLLAVAMIDGSVKVYSTLDGSCVAHFVTPNRSGDPILTFNPRGDRIAVAGVSGVLEIWNWEQEEKLIGLKIIEERHRQIAFSPDERYLALTSEKNILEVYDCGSSDRR